MSDLYVVRLYDVFDEIWIDVCEPMSKDKAEKLLAKETNNGKKNVKFDDLTYYKIFPADTKMLYSTDQWN